MSQVIVAARPDAAPSGKPVTSTLGTRIGSGVAAVRHALDGTPGRLRLMSAVCVLAAVVAALGGAAALQRRATALDDARQAAAHLVLLQGVQTNLVQADADATNAFLTFGLEPQASRLDYLASIQAASRDLATAAEAGPQDAAALGKANAALTRYTGYIASARADNRQQIPVAASYLSTASDDLRSTIIPLLQERSAADVTRIGDAYSRAGNTRWWLALVALGGLGALVGAQVYLARSSRRLVNPPAAAATLGLLLVLVVAGIAMAGAQSAANRVRSGDLKAVMDVSDSRVAAFDAKSRESLTLINRGSGSPQDPAWTAALGKAEGSLPADLTVARRALQAYAVQHKAIRALDDANQWNAAITKAKATGASSANGQFQAYATASENALSQHARAASSGLSNAGSLLLPVAVLVLLVGLLAAVSAWWGFSLRLDEYR